jgi:GNAT superfamily N-acetyltransferase
MEIDPLTIADLPMALRLSTLAGWNQVEQDWRRLIELYPESCFAGRVDGRLVATATLATYGQQVGWVGMVLVDPEHRHRGHATAMMNRVLEHAEARNIVMLGLDASDEGRPLYLKLGFEDGAPIHRLRREPAPAPTRPSDVFTPTDRDWYEMLNWDILDWSFDRTPLLNALRAETGVQVFASGLVGGYAQYCMRRPGRAAAHLGPMTALDPTSFTDLLLAALPGDEAVIADAWDTRVIPLLQAQGFRVVRTLMRMYRPAPPPPSAEPDALELAAAFELG